MTRSVGRSSDNGGELDTRALRRALGRFATGVCVVTALDANGHKLAMTVNSFTSVSLDPPLVLFSIARTCRGFEGWMSASWYGVNVLAASQAELSNRFAGTVADKWAGLTVGTGHTGVPVLPDALARFECKLERREDGGDHVMLLARVVAFDAALGADPLCFFAGRYWTLADTSVPTPAEPTLFYGW